MRRNEGRTVGLFTKVSPEEKEVIDQKMALLGTANLRAYLRKMAVDGYIVQLDMSSVVELVKLLRSISSNVNQIAPPMQQHTQPLRPGRGRSAQRLHGGLAGHPRPAEKI